MARATKKAFGIEALLSEITGEHRPTTIAGNMCIGAPIGCGGPATEFRDECSKREYRISGLCQKCQDAFFGT